MAAGVGAYALWGVFPLYWKILASVGPYEILANRIVWSCVFTFVVLLVSSRLKEILAVIKKPWTMLYLACSGILVSLNWGIYIWAVNNGKIIESSLGYYLNPLISVLLGVLVFKEKFDKWLGLAALLATAGISVFIIKLNAFPWISLSLAVTFAVYGVFKKLAKLDSMVALMLETLCVSPLALWYLLSLQKAGTAAFGTQGVGVTLLLVFAGVVTSIPLYLYAEGVKRLPLTTMGFLQYISPTGQFLLGVLVYHEKLSTEKAVTFGLVLAGLAVYMLSRNKKTPIAAQAIGDD